MNITLSTKWLVPWNGTCQICVRLAEGFSKKGHKVSIITNEENTETDWISNDVKIVQKPRKPISGYKIISEHLDKFRPDILHSHDNLGFYFEAFSIPHIVTSHSNWPRSWFLSKKHFIEGMVLELPHDMLMRLADQTIAVSKYSSQELERRGIRADYIYNGVEIPTVNPPKRSHIKALYVGGIGPRKGKHLPLIWKNMKQQNKDAELDVIGYPIDDGLVGELTDYPGVNFHGTVDSVSHFYKHANVLLFPSRAEACPLTVLEAQAYGCPVVAFDICSHQEIIDVGTTGSVVPAYNISRFTDEALHWAGSDNRKISEECQQWITENFSNSQMVNNYLKIYADLI